MKRSLFVLLIALLVTVAAQAGGKKNYGKELTVKETSKISDIIAAPEKFNGKRVKVKGPIVDVCKERGCWIKLGSDKEFESIRFKVDDGVIVFPLDLKGSNAVAEGVVSVRTVSVEDQIKSGKKMAAEEGTTFDEKSVTGPKTILQIKGEGAQVETK
ncbi:MAG: DUF4920 domain-containing protein [Bacteroidetes bacterium]|nr:DUF4920 domain-containing protein [Bacteroidota bacterium]